METLRRDARREARTSLGRVNRSPKDMWESEG